MMRVSEAAFALGVEHRGGNPLFTSVGTDSRNVKPGELFIALRGEHFDAHQYMGEAQASGAVAVIADAEGAALAPASLPLIMVNDTRKGLTQLAYAWRSRYTGPLLALTGSSGKTTVKEMLAAILREVAGADVLATHGNLNNEIGVPLTLLELRAEHRYAVIELGMNHAGEISRLTRLARPEVALITNAGHAHIEYLGSLDAIARAKGEIFEGLTTHGLAVINADDVYAASWLKLLNKNKYLQFGLDKPADIGARYELRALDSDLHITTPAGALSATLHAPGLHNVRNALAACAAAVALNVPLTAIATGLSCYAGVKGRLQRKAGLAGATVIDDTYNANPESTRAAIDVLSRTSGRRLLVLGDMGELGESAAACHAEIGAYARTAGIERLYALGDLSGNAVSAFGAGARQFSSVEELVIDAQPELAPNVTVLVKGSRFMKMERVVNAFAMESGAQKS
ncbi:MAG TPA: UDP-N-acetylmuramoyl-tripeptide--D-alanyl-D-alanine ligase [Burkholderiales bacterium]|nr:UDP-N-acetylmuramoyl-tripeptide--D-alanyl-D-alanine ligase [Burkholderiales bacterium]